MRATRLAAGVTAVLVGSAVVGSGSPVHADEVRDAQWHLAAVQVDEAHQYSLGAGVTVAVLDSGVDASHPDLRSNVLPGVDLTGRGTDGRDDPGGSGTALAGLIAGHGRPGVPAQPEPEDEDENEDEDAVGEPGFAETVPDGVLGLAPRAAILPVVVAGPGASPEAAVLAAGIDEAVRRGAEVICVGRPLPEDPVVNRALGEAVAAGVVVVAPGVPGGDAVARYGESGLLGAVPAARAQPAGAGEAGPEPGIVTVPASGTTSTGGQGGYYRFARTADAAATAVLAGAVALVRAAYPELAGHEVAHRIWATTDAGRLRLVDALTAPVAPPASPPAGPVDPVGPPPGAPGPGPAPAPAPAPGPEPGRDPAEAGWVAAFDSGDWRRWLVAAPLVVFLGALIVFSVTAARRARR